MAHLQADGRNNRQLQKPNLANKELAPDAKSKLTPEQQKELNVSLMKAVQNDKAYAIGQLLNLGAEIETKAAFSGMTPLIWSAAFGNRETCRLLLERGANINAKDGKGMTALMRAKLHGNMETADFLGAHMLLMSLGEEGAKTFFSNFRECTGQ